MEGTDRKIYRVSQLPRVLGLGETVIREEIAAGRLKAVRLRGFLAVTDEALAEYVAALPKVR